MFCSWKEIFKFKADNGNVNFQTQFCLGSLSNKLNYVESKKVSLKENEYDFSVDCNAIDKSVILTSHKYLKAKNNVK